ncbi:MAG: glycosyltransferase [Deltaproteobacteria bacterium]|nr:glycosyltransferase [Deltaproteobacteria bacterium]
MTLAVLGDIGRSPRMQYHALALASSLAEVDLVGYAGSALQRAVREHAHITCHLLSPPFLQRQHRLPRLVFLGYAVLKSLSQSCQLLGVLLFSVSKPQVIVLQNPPAVPTLFIAWLVARLRAAKLVIDWHNFGYTMFALKMGQSHPAVRLARWYEHVMGRRADAHLCVSHAMQTELRQNWDLQNVSVLYDRPAAVFAPTPLLGRQELFRRLQQDASFLPGYRPEARDRPALIVSSTSWTADEDFSILLEAASHCDTLFCRRAEQRPDRSVPQLYILITGKGPLREFYEEQIARLRLRHVHVQTLWLTAEDYPLLLGAADLGLCLHRSSSGLDLPMKIADMFGSGLPVCAFDYGPCLTELVRHGENGMVFSTSEQLANQLYELFQGFPSEAPLLAHLQSKASEGGRIRWLEGWQREAQPVFERLAA